MAVYSYRAIDVDATAVSGTVVADTGRQAREHLRDRGLTVTRIDRSRSDSEASWLAHLAARRCRQETASFVGELGTLLDAGIALLPALKTLARQHSMRLGTVVRELADEVAAGHSLADAMARRPAWFGVTAVSIVRVGERAGSLSASLNQLADFAEKASAVRNRLATALLYPAIVGCVGVAVTVFLMTFVVPNLLTALTEANKELPTVTTWVKAASDLLSNWWWFLLLAVAALVAAVGLTVRTERGAGLRDRLLLCLPIIGDLIRKETTSRMAVVMAALLRSGLQFVDAIRITSGTLSNRVFRKALDEYEQAVTAGKDVAGPLAASGVFSPMVVQMLAVGQEAGRLEDMLERVAETYDRQVEQAAQRLTAALEPLMIVLLAVVVGFIAFATILPILEVSNVM